MYRSLVRTLSAVAVLALLTAVAVPTAHAAPRTYVGAVNCKVNVSGTVYFTVTFPERIERFNVSCSPSQRAGTGYPTLDTTWGNVLNIEAITSTSIVSGKNNLCKEESRRGFLSSDCMANPAEGMSVIEILLSIPDVP